MKDHELSAIILAKNKAWAALADADRHCLAYQRSRFTPTGYPELPDGWEERREELAEAYRASRASYMRAMLQRAG